jgi:hypothetical protein
MEYLVIWIIFGVISSIIASNKGNSGCGGFLLGALLGPIGLLIALFSSDNKPKVFNPINYTRRCPYCAELVHNEAIVCKHCSRDIPIETIAKNERIPNSSDQKSQNKSLKFSNSEKTLFFSIAFFIVVLILARVFIPIYNESVAENEEINSHSLINNPVKSIESQSLLKESAKTIKQSEDIIQTFKQLHSELMVFKSTEEFKIHGLSYTGPYSDWLVRVNDLKSHQNVNDLIRKGIVPGDLEVLAMEYKTSKGKETDYTKSINIKIQKAISSEPTSETRTTTSSAEKSYDQIKSTHTLVGRWRVSISVVNESYVYEIYQKSDQFVGIVISKSIRIENLEKKGQKYFIKNSKAGEYYTISKNKKLEIFDDEGNLSSAGWSTTLIK